jgi:hypothetical protein
MRYDGVSGSDGIGGHPDSSTSSRNGIPYRGNTVRGWRAEPVLAARQINKSTTGFRVASVVCGSSSALLTGAPKIIPRVIRAQGDRARLRFLLGFEPWKVRRFGFSRHDAVTGCFDVSRRFVYCSTRQFSLKHPGNR